MHTWISAAWPGLPGRSFQVPSDWMGSLCEGPSSGLSTDELWGLSLDFGWASQEQSETGPEATPLLFWLFASGHYPAGR